MTGTVSTFLAAGRRPTVVHVTSRDDVRAFLTSRRERLSPEQAGLPVFGRNRRVKGLRREEVALLAGVSVEYYTKLERGNLSGASDSVLDAISSALQLDEVERTHLYDLARAASRPRSRAASSRVRPSIQRILDGMSTIPASVRNGRFDILAANQLGRALYSPLFESPLFGSRRPVNAARFLFLDPAAQDFFGDWDKSAEDAVAFLRLETGQSPHDRALTELVGELTTRSQDFARRWAKHNVKAHRTGVKHLRHPVVGDLHLPYEALDLSADVSLRINVYTPEPDSDEQSKLALLASWSQAPAISQ